MRAPVLKIRKKVLDVQGQNRPCVQVQALMDDKLKALLLEHFGAVTLFKRSMYPSGLPEGSVKPKPELACHFNSFLKDDGCPEISVKSILSGQLYQAKDPWGVLCFEFIGKRAFDALGLLTVCATELGTETEYTGNGSETLSVDATSSENDPKGGDETEPNSPSLTIAA